MLARGDRLILFGLIVKKGRNFLNDTYVISHVHNILNPSHYSMKASMNYSMKANLDAI